MIPAGRPARWGAALALVLALPGCTEATGPAQEQPTGTTTQPSTGAPTRAAGSPPSPTRSPSPTPDPQALARGLLTDVDAAGRASPDEVRTAVDTALQAEMAGLVNEEWEGRVRDLLPSWPIHVGEATLGLDGSVDLDMVLVAPPDDDGELVLRWLPSAPALGDAVEDLSVTVGGTTADVTVDADGARLSVPVRPDQAAVVRVTAAYRVPARTTVVDDGTPAGYGLLARTDDAVMLGHWLPLVALPGDDGPMLSRGDVGAFPPAVFSLVVQHEGTLVSGGEERACPERAPDCTWLQGVGLRDVSALVHDRATAATATTSSGVAATAHAPGGEVTAESVQQVADEAAAALEALTDDLGRLPWPSLDVVAAPIAPGAAGMEFPGMVWVDTGAWPHPGPDFGSYVLAHEVGHQWFHALVGNGSLSAPVVDESLAQYLSVVAFDDLFGEGEGTVLAERFLGGRHDAALDSGVPDEAPAQALGDFATAQSYGAAVYGRGGQAWVDAEQVVGRPAILDALRVLVDRFGWQQVDEQEVLDVVREVAPDAADVLVEGWGMTP